MLAGPLVVAVGLFVRVGQIWPAIVGTAPSVCEVDVTGQRTRLIADALNRLLHETDIMDGSASIVLADGRCVPLSLSRDVCFASGHEFGELVALDVAAQPGTTLLLFSDDAVASFNTASDECSERRVADLPAGTIAQLTQSDVAVLAHASTDVPALEAALRRVQRQLVGRCPRFSALLVTPAPPVGSSVRRPDAVPRIDKPPARPLTDHGGD